MGIPRCDEFHWNPNEYRFADDNQVETKIVTLQAGHVFVRGSVLGRVDATGEYVLCAKVDGANAAIADGSQKARLVLASDVDTTAASKKGVTYSKGTLSTKWLILGAGHTLDTIEDDLRGLGIYFRQPSIPAVG